MHRSGMLPYWFSALFAINLLAFNGHFSEKTMQEIGEQLVIANAIGDVFFIFGMLVLIVFLRRKYVTALATFSVVSIMSSTVSFGKLMESFHLIQAAFAFAQFAVATTI